jgi:hypothetical protein
MASTYVNMDHYRPSDSNLQETQKMIHCFKHNIALVEKLNAYVGHYELVCPIEGCDYWLCLDDTCHAGHERIRHEQYHKRPYAGELKHQLKTIPTDMEQNSIPLEENSNVEDEEEHQVDELEWINERNSFDGPD